MQDAWRAYLELALGLTEAPRKRAQDAARRLAGTGGATAVQLQALAEELLATGAANREALTKLVRFEVDRALGAVGLATADEVAELTRRVHELERQLREAKGGPGGSPVGDTAPDTTVPSTGGAGTARDTGVESGAAAAAGPAPATVADAAAGTARASTGVVAKKAVAKKAVAKKAVTPTTVATTAPKAVAKKAVAKKAVAKKAGPAADTAPSAARSTGADRGAPPPGKGTPGHDGSGGAG
ncbi:phasin family protein [Micromonospora sp. WMMD735]|uniref:phasin family protein n=1 Tax=Micromonospora sp. WMMD735 TaxID=3404130 RepID=UPI003B93B9FD